MQDILQFTGEHRWLSNFYPVNIKYGTYIFPSVEHAYQSSKSSNVYWKEYCADTGTTPGAVKRASRKVELLPSWDSNKVVIMTNLLRRKFIQEPFTSNLLETGTCLIEEGNYWGDTFWGVDLLTRKGQNNLGKLIMLIRYEIISKTKLKLKVPCDIVDSS